MRQLLFDWFLVVVLVTMLAATGYGVSKIYGDDADYWKAKVSAANALAAESNPWLPPVPKPNVPTPPPPVAAKVDARPVVTGYSTKACSREGYPCHTAKEALKAAEKDLPFQVKWVDISNGGGPPWCDRTPAFEWETPTRVRYTLGWYGVKELTELWKANQQQPQARSPPDSHFGLSLTPEQQAMYQQAKAAGYSDQQILNYARRHGYLK